MAATDLDLGRYQLGWSDKEDYIFKPKKGLNESIVREMSEMKSEPQWMRDFRLRALKNFERKPMAPWFATQMPDLDFDDIFYYIKPTGGQVDDWNDLPDAIKNTYEKLGIPEAERKYLAGVTAQYESEVVFHRNREDLESQGVLFCDMDTAVRDYPDIVRKWFGKIIPPNDNKFAALNSAVWSGGSFIYVPPGVNVDMPLQAYFRINAENMGQFERTLIGAGLHHRLPPLGRGRAGGAARLAHHVHDDPELVDQRLQPGDQAGPGRGRGARGVDRRQHRLAPHHEVPLGVPDGAEGER
jgi:Fe-S cluster assembly protein SufB